MSVKFNPWLYVSLSSEFEIRLELKKKLNLSHWETKYLSIKAII